MSSSLYISVHRENFYYKIGKITRSLNTIKPDWSTAFELSRLFRRMGISCLFIDDDTESLYFYLNCSANSFLHFAQNLNEKELITSRFEAFFDALLCKNVPVAKKIAKIHPKSFNKDYEYQEDFLYFHFLMEFVQNIDLNVLKQILTQYENCLDGNPDARLSICKALMQTDKELFEEGLIQLIQDWESEQQRLREKELVSGDVLETEGYVFIEGLALLRIAEEIGIFFDDSFSYMPVSVIQFLPLEYENDNWKYVAID